MKKIFVKFKCKYLLFIIPIIIFMVNTVRVDNDIWFLLNHGRYVLNNGFPYVEPFTIHEGLSFVMQQWGSALIYWIVYNYIGEKALFLFVIIIGTIITIMFYKLCKLVSNNINISLILALLFSFTIRNYIVARPQIFTYLILILELYYLESYIKTNDNKKLYILPLLSLIQINMHASMFIFQFLFILPFIINGIKLKKVKLSTYKLKPILFITILMLLIGFLNPYGYEAITYIFNSYGIDYVSNYIAEMQVLTFKNVNCKILILCICFLIFLFNYLKNNKIELRHLFLLFGTTLLAFMQNKGLPYFFIIYFYILAYFLKNFKIKLLLKRLKDKKYIKSILFGLKIGFYTMLLFTLIYTLNYSFNYLNYRNALDETAEVLINDMKVSDIRLYVRYEYGGYMELMGIKSYIDPRAEVFVKKLNKKSDIMKEYTQMDDEDFDYKKFINKYKFTHFVVSPDENINDYLSNNKKYKLIFKQYDDENNLIVNVYKTLEE